MGISTLVFHNSWESKVSLHDLFDTSRTIYPWIFWTRKFLDFLGPTTTSLLIIVLE